MAATITTAELAATLETTPRELRKFLRSELSNIDSVGKGSRYALPADKRSIAALGKRFAKWAEADKAAKAAKAVTADASDEADTED